MFLTLLLAFLCCQPVQATTPFVADQVATVAPASHNADKALVESEQVNHQDIPALPTIESLQGSVELTEKQAQQAKEPAPATKMADGEILSPESANSHDILPTPEQAKKREHAPGLVQREKQGESTAIADKETLYEEFIGIIRLGDKMDNTKAMIDKIISFGHDESIKGVLFVVDCGGGPIGTSEILFRELRALALKKPIVTITINLCCSGAYWAAIASNWIVAQSSSVIGSIGVKYIIEKGKNYKQNDPSGYTADVDFTIICAGKFKGTSDEKTAPISDEERLLIQEYVDQQYEIFTSFVAQARDLSLEKVSDWAEGKMFTGAQALKLGLIDEIGGYSDAVKKLEQLIAERGIVVTQKLVFTE